jgi:hypothetical protein
MDQVAVVKSNRLGEAPHRRISATAAGGVLETREGAAAADPTGTMKASTLATPGTVAAVEVAGRSTSRGSAAATAAMITSGGSGAAMMDLFAASVDLAACAAKPVARGKESPIPFINCNYNQDL